MKITDAGATAKAAANETQTPQVIYRYGGGTSIATVEFDVMPIDEFTNMKRSGEKTAQYVQTITPEQWDAGYTPKSIYSPAQIEAMRDWAKECEWHEDEETIDEMSDEEIIAGVEKNYEGGVAAFDFTGC